jgi:hypothetical protein
MSEIDQEYAGRVRDLENLFKGAKLTNYRGEKVYP